MLLCKELVDLLLPAGSVCWGDGLVRIPILALPAPQNLEENKSTTRPLALEYYTVYRQRNTRIAVIIKKSEH